MLGPLLQNCIKVSNEPPTDMRSNMRRAWAAFPPEFFDRASTPAKAAALRAICFGLCFFHSVLLGRKKYGTGEAGQGRDDASRTWPARRMSCWPDNSSSRQHAPGLRPAGPWCLGHNLRYTQLLTPAGIGTGTGSGLGYCRNYSFNSGDLATCGDVILNYVEGKAAVPWADLRYLVGEVFYGEGT